MNYRCGGGGKGRFVHSEVEAMLCSVWFRGRTIVWHKIQRGEKMRAARNGGVHHNPKGCSYRRYLSGGSCNGMVLSNCFSLFTTFMHFIFMLTICCFFSHCPVLYKCISDVASTFQSKWCRVWSRGGWTNSGSSVASLTTGLWFFSKV